MENKKLIFTNYGTDGSENILEMSIDEDNLLLVTIFGQGLTTGIYLDKNHITALQEYFKLIKDKITEDK